MVAYRCAECDARVSRPVARLRDESLLVDAERAATTTGAGEPDLVPAGFRLDGTNDAVGTPYEARWTILNPGDATDTSLDLDVYSGCCGPSGSELNTDCRNGHAVGVEVGDCYTVHAVAFDRDLVVASESRHTVTPGLDECGASDWLDVLDDGSRSDRRRAIVLLGRYRVTEAVPALAAIAREGPEELRDVTVRALRDVGTADLEALESALWAETQSARLEAARAIGELANERTEAVLLDRLADEPTREVCSEIHSALGGRPPVETVRSRLADATSAAAMRFLIELLPPAGRDDAVAAILRNVVTDRTAATDVRREAVWKLGSLDDEALVARQLVDLVAELPNGSDVQRRCLESLEHHPVHHRTTREDLRAAVDDVLDDPDVPDAVLAAARNCRDEHD